MTLTPQEMWAGFIIGVAAAFVLGRYSTKVAFFHARVEEKLTVPEFIRSRQ